MSVHLFVVICTAHSKVISAVMPINVDLVVQKPQDFFDCVHKSCVHEVMYYSLHNSIQMENCRFQSHGSWKNLARDCHM